jgi:hypothetical protein
VSEPRPALRAAARVWRLGAVGAVAALLLYGSAWGQDDNFPFGPMNQYSFRTDPNGPISALWLDADTAAGTHLRLNIAGSDDVGIARAELEGQLDRILADPSRLQELAQAWARLHPDRPGLTRLTVGQDVTQLHHGHPAERHTEVFTHWDVTP